MKIVEIRISESKQAEKINRNVLFKEIENCGQLIAVKSNLTAKIEYILPHLTLISKGLKRISCLI